MAKRFIDTKIWDKAWFRKLTTKNKLLWVYILTKCDHAGIWDADWEAAEFFIGEVVSFDDLPEVIQSKMSYIKGEDQYYIPSFIEFQYGVLKENSKPHLSVIKRLNEKGLLKGNNTLTNKNITPKAKDKDKVKVKVKDKAIREQYFKTESFKIGNTTELINSGATESLVSDFTDYWTESNHNGQKMRFEMQKTFDIKRRLTKWVKNDKEWSANKPVTKKSLESKFTKVKSGMGYKAWCSKCGKKEMPSDFFAIKKGSSCCAVDYLNHEPKKKNITAIEEGLDHKGDAVDFETFKKNNPDAKGINHISKYL
jgi:hypothetical protein